jgi:phosphoglycolate phosphatase
MPQYARPRAVLFDWDNTLVDSWGTIHLSLVHTLEALGHETWSFEETKARVRHSLRESFPKQFGERWEEARRIYMDHFTSIHLERLRALDGAEQLVRELKAAGLYVAVVSNKTGPVLRREADKLGWTEHFVRLVGAGDASADKPDAAPMRMALEHSDIELGDSVWYVGDTGIDMECAINSGCVGVLLHEIDHHDQSLTTFPPKLHFRTCQALSTHIGRLTFPFP